MPPTIDFNPREPATWPLALSLEQVAAIYQRSPNAIRHGLRATARTRFLPAPYKSLPYRWRKADVTRDLLPKVGVSL